MASSKMPTFQMLIRVPVDHLSDSADLYSEACSEILEIAANSSKYSVYEDVISCVSRCLVSMTAALNTNGTIQPLAAMLNLLTILTCSLPLFTSSLLTQTQENSESKIIVVLCDIVRRQLDPSQHADSLARETITILEALCWNIKDELSSKLSLIVSTDNVLMTLLHTSQPSWLLARTARLLTFLATHSALFRVLLSLPNSDDVPAGEPGRDLSKIPHIERLCSYLIDTAWLDTESITMGDYVLSFFGMLSITHTDAHAILVGSYSLIPSLVFFVTQLTTPLWEDEERLMTSPEITTSLIHTLNQSLFLLHHLVFGVEPVFNLRHKLHYAPHRPFNGITHMFIVSFGRLSYADSPDWIDASEKLELELVSEMARDLLDLVVDGPEGDSVWAAYQADPDNASDTDEEEMEAKLLGETEDAPA